MLRFENYFWGNTSDPLLGIQTLNAEFEQGFQQLEQFAIFLKESIVLQDWYGNRLKELGQSPVLQSSDGREDILGQIFTEIKQETNNLGEMHQTVSRNLYRCLNILQKFIDDNKKLPMARKDQLSATFKLFEKQKMETDEFRQGYIQKCRLLDYEKKKYEALLASDPIAAGKGDVTLGLATLTSDEFNAFINSMQQDIRKEDVFSILGTYKDCLRGEDVVKYVRSYLSASDGNAMMVCNDLIKHGFIRPISGGTKFASAQYYQWKRESIENEMPHVKAEKEVLKYSADYRRSASECDESRLQFEQSCVDFMNRHQHLHHSRLELVKRTLNIYCGEHTKTISAGKDMFEKISLLLETFQPQKLVQAFIEQDRTGSCRIPPVLAIDYYRGVQDYVFGVSLEDMALRGQRVPILVHKTLAVIHAEATRLAAENEEVAEIDLWLEPSMNMSAVHALRNELNTNNGNYKVLRRFPLPVIIGLFKLYLMELPISVCSYDIYEPLKLLYLSKSEDFDVTMRLNSLRSLLASMSSPHYHTMGVIMNHLQRTIGSLKKEDVRITHLAQLLGPIVLRPKMETKVTLHDKHPARFLKDLLLYCRSRNLIELDREFSTDKLTPSSESPDVTDLPFDSDEELSPSPLTAKNDRTASIDDFEQVVDTQASESPNKSTKRSPLGKLLDKEETSMKKTRSLTSLGGRSGQSPSSDTSPLDSSKASPSATTPGSRLKPKTGLLLSSEKKAVVGSTGNLKPNGSLVNLSPTKEGGLSRLKRDGGGGSAANLANRQSRLVRKMGDADEDEGQQASENKTPTKTEAAEESPVVVSPPTSLTPPVTLSAAPAPHVSTGKPEVGSSMGAKGSLKPRPSPLATAPMKSSPLKGPASPRRSSPLNPNAAGSPSVSPVREYPVSPTGQVNPMRNLEEFGMRAEGSFLKPKKKVEDLDDEDIEVFSNLDLTAK